MRVRCNSLLALFFLVLLCPGTYSQQAPFRRYTVADGLPENRVMQLYEDRYGFTWCLSQNGISRTDGHEIISYTSEEGLTGIKPANITEDSNGDIWVLTEGGLSRFNGRQFDPWPLPSDSAPTLIHYSLASDDKGNLYFHATLGGGEHKIIRFDGLDYHTDYIDLELPDQEGIYSTYYSKLYHRLYLATTEGLYIVQRDSLIRLQIPGKTYLFERRGYLFAQEEEGKLYHIAGDGMFAKPVTDSERSIIRSVPYIMNGRDESYILLDGFKGTDTLKWSHGFMNYILRDSRHNTWVGSEDGLYRLISEDFEVFGNGEIPDGNIWSVVEDREGYIWFSSVKGMIYRYNEQRFENMTQLLPSHVRNFTVGSRVMPSGEIWFTTFTGIIAWDGKRFRDLDIAEGQVESIYADEQSGEILIGTETGLKRITSERLINYPEMSPGNLGFVRDICRVDSSAIFIASEKGIYRFDGHGFQRIFEGSGIDLNPFAIETDNQGNIWIGSDAGLFYCETGCNEIVNALPTKENSPVRAIVITADNRVLVGRTGDFITISPSESRPGGYFSYRRYNQDNGFLVSGVRQGGITIGADRDIWITGNDGVIRFLNGRTEAGPVPPQFYITEIEVMTHDGEWEERASFSPYIHPVPDFVVLEPGESALRLNLAGLERCGAGEMVFSYRLSGSGMDWSEASPERIILIPGLEKGRSSIEIKSFYPQTPGLLSTKSIDVKVMPLFFERTMVRVILIILLLGAGTYAGIVIRRSRESRIKEKTRLVREQYRLQMGSFTQQFDPHFTFNVLSSLSTLNIIGKPELADEYLVKFSALLRSVIEEDDFLKPLGRELEFISGYCDLHKLKLGERFSFRIETDNPAHLETKIPRMMIHNFVENAIKWGISPRVEGGEVVVRVTGNGNTIITVTDNGIGRLAASEMTLKGTGKGYRVTTSLVDLLNSFNRQKMSVVTEDLYDEKGEAAGTRVTVTIPERFEYYM